MEIGVDTGGTFTDLVARAPGQPDRILKVPSTPDDPARAVLDGVAKLLDAAGARPADVGRVVHGTTVATNAVLERKGARTGILTTRGFRDVLEIGRMIRSSLYDLELEPQTPVFLAPRERRLEVGGRIAATGEVIEDLDEDAVAAAADRFAELGCEAVAVCFLFSFFDPSHEQRAAAIIAARHPGITISLSSEVDPAFREYERTAATAFDAYTKPALSHYLARMAAELRRIGVSAPLQIMQSRGGVSAATTATRRPVRLFLSGPAAGVIGGGEAGRATDTDNLITVDIGGTSCDIALINDGRPRIRSEGRIDGFPVRVSMVDVNAIGAGGGSVAWLDAAGGLRVGPHSAGAAPGPAAYGRGGDEPTVTDASLVLGLLNPDFFAGGDVRLDPDRARAAIATRIAAPLGLSVEAAAQGIHRVVNAQMAEGMRLVSIRQGFDPRDFTLVPLGGAGPVHAIALAEELGMSTIVIPRNPGVLSAAGLLSAPVEHETLAGYPWTLAESRVDDLRAAFATLDRQCAGLMAAEEVPRGAVTVDHLADVCYVGQSHYLEIPLDLRAPDPLAATYQAFMRTHEQVFGYSTESPARFVNLRSVHRANQRGDPGAALAAPDAATTRTARASAQPTAPAGRTRRAMVGSMSHPASTPVFTRSELSTGALLEGPAIVEQADTTVVIHPGWRAEVAPEGNLEVRSIDS